MRSRLWLIPLTFLAALTVAWVLRWDYSGEESGGIYYKDRWLGQVWIKANDGQPDHPVITDEVLDRAAQTAINGDPSLLATYQGLEQGIVQQNAIRNANEPFAQEYTRILTQQNSTDVVQLLTGEITGEEISIPEEIRQGENRYEESSYQLQILTQQKEALWQSARASAERSLYDQAASQRQLTAYTVAALVVINLIWLAYVLGFFHPRTVSSANGPLGPETSGDEINN